MLNKKLPDLLESETSILTRVYILYTYNIQTQKNATTERMSIHELVHTLPSSVLQGDLEEMIPL